MYITQSTHRVMAERQEPRGSLFVPQVYESVDKTRWEYHVVKVDPREEELPGVEQLNELGQSGWLLIGMLDERATGKGSQVYYYFVRSAN
jgi:hypothetical protein